MTVFRVHTNELEIDLPTSVDFGFPSKTHYTSEKCPTSEKCSPIRRSKANIKNYFSNRVGAYSHRYIYA